MDQQNNGPTDKDNYIAPLWIKRGLKLGTLALCDFND